MATNTRREILILDRRLEAERDYWVGRLTPQPQPTTLLSDYARPAGKSFGTDRVEFTLSDDTVAKLTGLTGGGDFLLYTTLMAALKTCLRRHAGGDMIVVASP